ncbi:MAG: Trm112 family protein [Smithellaceae bacterium]|nr:Trm112 family protein [Smithellaceae bacterium]
MPVNEKLLEIIACPKCKGKVILDESAGGLICRPCRLYYEIKDGIPVMLVEEAKQWEES